MFLWIAEVVANVMLIYEVVKKLSGIDVRIT